MLRFLTSFQIPVCFFSCQAFLIAEHMYVRHNNIVIISELTYSIPLNGQGHAYQTKLGFEQITNLHAWQQSK